MLFCCYHFVFTKKNLVIFCPSVTVLGATFKRLNKLDKALHSAQLAKGYHFAQKFSKYFFHFTLGQKISKVIVLSWFTFFKGKEVFLNFQFFLSMYSKTQKTKKMRLYQPHLFGFLCFWVHTQENLKIEKNWS